MQKRILSIALILALLIVLLPPVPARAAPAAPAAAGAWVLVSAEDHEANDYTSPDDMDYHGTVDYVYQPSSYAMNWATTWKEDDKEYTSSGVVSASFTVPPQRILPGETVTLTAHLSSSANSNYPDTSGSPEEYPPSAWIKFAGLAENTEKYEYSYTVPSATFNSGFDDTRTVTFTLPEGDELATAGSMWVEFGLSNPADMQHMSTHYNYQWVPAAAVTQPAAASSINLKGLVRSVEDKPMPWMKLQAYVYYNTAAYDGTKQPDLIVDSAADYLGRYDITVPLREGDAQPVGILLIGSLTCVYPYAAGQNAFYFVDMAEPFSQTNNGVSVSTWLTVNPAEEADPDHPEDPILIYRTLGFYNLGLDAWSFDEDLTPDPVYHFSTNPEQAQLLQNYSMLYTTAYDAWFFGAAVLKEEQGLIASPPRIELRWTPTATLTTSHYAIADNTIRLTDLDCKRDDNSRFTILHEFGHAFDAITVGSGSFRAGASYGANDVNHGGYFNSSTSDSYMEGFATCFAGLTQRFSGYDNPAKLDWITLSDPSDYVAWGNNGKNEEFAIASLLYCALPLMGDVTQYWSVLDPDRANFYEYYDALAKALPAASAQTLADYAFRAGLYQMPFGNSQYDPGEPFQDLADANGQMNGQRDSGEAYADLMFAVGADGQIDVTQPLQTYSQQNLTIGASSDALRVRKTIEKPENGYLYLSGELPEYLLVTVRRDTGDATRMLRAVDVNRVFIGLPDTALAGSLEVSVPGGSIIYTGDLAALRQKQQETAGQSVPLAEAVINAGDLAAPGTQTMATYGSAEATGLLTIPRMSRDELIRQADRYNPNAAMDEIALELHSGTDRPDSGSDDGDDTDTGSMDTDSGMPTRKSLSGISILIIAVILAVVLVAGIILIVVLATRRRKPAAAMPYAYPATPPAQPMPMQQPMPMPAQQPIPARRRQPAAPPVQHAVVPPIQHAVPPVQHAATNAVFCRHCGASNIPGNQFCQSCGQPMTVKRFCTHCGNELSQTDEFCGDCGKKNP